MSELFIAITLAITSRLGISSQSGAPNAVPSIFAITLAAMAPAKTQWRSDAKRVSHIFLNPLQRLWYILVSYHFVIAFCVTLCLVLYFGTVSVLYFGIALKWKSDVQIERDCVLVCCFGIVFHGPLFCQDSETEHPSSTNMWNITSPRIKPADPR